jgi:transposase
MNETSGGTFRQHERLQREVKMKLPEEVEAVLRLHRQGWGTRRIAVELGMSRNTVRRYVRQGSWCAYKGPKRAGKLAGLEDWLAERFRRHRGNAEVVRQELASELGVSVSLRTVERAVAPLRQQLRAEARATVRFETEPGHQLQIDFGERRVWIGGEQVKVHLFVATLGYSRRLYVQAFTHQRQSAWLSGLEGAFRHFEGVPQQILLDNARALVDYHDPVTREVRFNARFHAFCHYWGVQPQACAPNRARTKGKDERGVGYVKHNAIAGRRFDSWAQLEAHLVWWQREIADQRYHGTTGERPIDRFEAAEAQALSPLDGKAPFLQIRELSRRVHTDACVEVDTHHYSVPWRLIGEMVRVQLSDGQVRIYHGAIEVAQHPEQTGQRRRCIDPAHLQGIVSKQATVSPSTAAPSPVPAGELQRPLSEYEAIVGGAW